MGGAQGYERRTVLEAVKQNRVEANFALAEASEALKRDPEIVLAAVRQNGWALQFAAECCRRDREIVLAAVSTDGRALQYASEECQRDGAIVLAAVTQDGLSLAFTSESWKRDRELVMKAIKQNEFALNFAGEELLLDRTFAKEVKLRWYILKIGILSGRYIHCIAAALELQPASRIIRYCCKHFRLAYRGNEVLVHGDALVPHDAEVQNWPGIRQQGEVTEYQLVMQP
mmetsp:Transcript_8074/g.18898  ORF Transcript_8074/g.18898 Transcript_8074/m.18898 type:complete len:229 (-) Transcript_8074:65-751(-)